MNLSDLKDKLVENGYQGLFWAGGNHSEQLWANGENEEKLKYIIRDSSNSFYQRFLSAEVLRIHGGNFDSEMKSFLAEIYFEALQYSSVESAYKYGLMGNLWGLVHEEDYGEFGEMIIQLGPKAVPYLQQLLNNANAVLFEGSEEATIGNQYQYRIKDFAAFYLSKITNFPITFYQDSDQRDAEIERLKKMLNEAGYGKK